jgi:hypothetical protein
VEPSAAARILTLCAVYDRRTIGEADARAWGDVLGPVRFEDAAVAVRQHYAVSREWIMPSEVKEGVRHLRAERLARITDQVPAADPDDVAGYLHDLRQARHRVADGTVGTEIATLR